MGSLGFSPVQIYDEQQKSSEAAEFDVLACSAPLPLGLARPCSRERCHSAARSMGWGQVLF